MNVQSQNFHLFVGTYTNTDSKGIYVYKFNANTGTATLLSTTDSTVNPSYLAISPNKKFLFAVNETHGDDPGKVSSFLINNQSGKLTFINQQLTGGDDPCYVAVHNSNQWITVGNYSGGSTAVLQVEPNGTLKPYAQLIQNTGKGTNPQRQEKPHVHATVFSPNHDFLFTPDLGTDKIMVYKFNATAQRPLSAVTPSYISTQPGAGPRHLTFHPNNKFAYLIEEMAGVVSVYQYANGKLSFTQRVSTHTNGFDGDISSADIHISPDGKFLYASNRGDANSISIFVINPANGRLTIRGYQSVAGKTPRNFVIDPTGNYLLVANQGSNAIVIFRRNKTTGLLTATGQQIDCPLPVCLKMM